MLSKALAVTTIAVTDLDRAKEFYGGTLRLVVLEETPFTVRYGTARGSQLSVRRGTPSIDQTVVHFEIDDIESAVKELSERGVRFEEYESPKTENHIANVGPARGAWFKDPDGNVIGLRQGVNRSLASHWATCIEHIRRGSNSHVLFDRWALLGRRLPLWITLSKLTAAAE